MQRQNKKKWTLFTLVYLSVLHTLKSFMCCQFHPAKSHGIILDFALKTFIHKVNKKGSEGWVKVICDLFNYVYCVYVCITVCLMCLCVWTHVWYVCLCMCVCVSVWVCNQRCSWCSNAVKEIRAAASSHVIGEFLRNMFATAALPVWPTCRGFDLCALYETN